MKKVKCILLIDDDDTTNIINEMLIMEMGITQELLLARNGKEGLNLINSYFDQHKMLPDLILLDINMPVMDGFAFLEAYHQLDLPGKSSVNIVMLTTSLNSIDVERAEKAGITDYINKPLLEETLKSLLEKHMGQF